MGLTRLTPTEPTARIPTGPTGPIPTEPTARPSGAEGFPKLSSLVGADNLDAFLAHRFGKDQFRRRLPPGAALFDWARLNEALAQHRLAPPRLRLELAGADATKGVFKERRTRRGALLHDLDPAVLNQRLRDGATLIVDAANELSASLQALCAGLSAELVGACQANLYACWGRTQGFDVHWDDHDVFVVQVEGTKRWSLYGATRPWPTRRDHHQDHPKPETPIEEIVLEPGDLLYLPRGYWHAAVGTGGPTMHLTIGVTRKTGTDLLHWMADQAVTHAPVRADLPLEADDAALGRHIQAVIAAAVSGADPAELGRRYRRSVETGLPRRPALSFPFIGGEGAAYPAATAIRLTEGGGRLGPAAQPGAVVLSHRGTDYTLVAELGGVVADMVAGRPVRYADLEGAVREGDRPLVAAFVGDMVARGVFVLGPP